MDKGAWRATIHEVTNSQTSLSDMQTTKGWKDYLASSDHKMCLEHITDVGDPSEDVLSPNHCDP